MESQSHSKSSVFRQETFNNLFSLSMIIMSVLDLYMMFPMKMLLVVGGNDIKSTKTNWMVYIIENSHPTRYLELTSTTSLAIFGVVGILINLLMLSFMYSKITGRIRILRGFVSLKFLIPTIFLLVGISTRTSALVFLRLLDCTTVKSIFTSNEMVIESTITEDITSENIQFKHVMGLFNNIDCYSPRHILMCVLFMTLFLMLAITSALMMKYSQIWFFRDIPMLPEVHHRAFSIVSLLMIVILTNLIFEEFTSYETFTEWLLLIVVSIQLLVYISSLVLGSDYNPIIRCRTKDREFFKLLVTIALGLMYKLTKEAKLYSDIEDAILMLLMFSALLKMHLILRKMKMSNEEIITRLEKSDVNNNVIYTLIFRLIMHLNHLNNSEQMNSSIVYKDKENLFWITIFGNHMKQCKRRTGQVCIFCRDTIDITTKVEFQANRSNIDSYSLSIIYKATHFVNSLIQEKILSRKIDSTLLRLYLNFCIEIKIDYITPSFILFTSRDQIYSGKSLSLFEQKIFKSKLFDFIEDSLIRRSFVTYLHHQQEPLAIYEDPTYYTTIIEVHRSQEKLKRRFVSCLEVSIEVFDEMLGKCRYSKLKALCHKLFRLKKSSEEYIEKVEIICKGEYSPILISHCFFVKNIFHNSKKHFRLLKLVSRIRNQINMEFSIKTKPSEEMVVLSVITPKDHESKIVLCSGNTEKLFKHCPRYLEGESLELLVPSYFRGRHSKSMQIPSLEGSILEKREPSKIFCKTGDGYISRVSVEKRVIFSKKHGVHFLGTFRGSLENDLYQQGAHAILTKEGIILDIEASFSSILTIGSDIRESCVILAEEIERMNHTYDLINSDRNILDYQRDKKAHESWVSYFEWQEGRKAVLQAKNRIAKTFHLRINEHIFQNTYVWIISAIELGSSTDLKKLGIERSLNSSIRVKSYNHDRLDEIHRILMVHFEDRKEELQDVKSEAQASETREKEIILSRVFRIVTKKTITQDLDLKVKGVNPFTSINDIQNRSQLDENISREDEEKNDNEILSERPHLEEVKLNKNISLIRKKLKNLKYSKITIISLLLMTPLPFLFISTSFYSIYSYKKSSLELFDQSPTADLYSFAVTPYQLNTYYLNAMRASREGWIPGDYLEYIYPGKSVYWFVSKLYPIMAVIFTQADSFVSDKMNVLRYPELFPISDYVHGKALYDDPEFDHNNKFIGWRTSYKKKRDIVARLEVLGRRIILRDYQNDSTIPGLEGTTDRNKDLEEEELRRGCQGDLSHFYQKYSFVFDSYIKTVGDLPGKTVAIELVISISIVVLFLFSVVLMGIIKTNKTKVIAGLLFNMHKSEVKKLRESAQTIIDREKKHHNLRREPRLLDRQEVSIQSKKQGIDKMKNPSSSIIQFKENNNIQGTYNKINLVAESKTICLLQDRTIIFLLLFVFTFLSVKLILGREIFISSRICSNIMKVNIIYVESWNMMINAHNAAIEAVLWNDTSKVWGRQASEMAYEYISWNKDNIITNLSDARSWNLGNYTERFYRLNFVDNVCGTIYLLKSPGICDKVYGGALNTPMMSTYRTFLIFLENLMANWEISKASREDTLRLLNSSTARSIWPFFEEVAYDFYFSLVIDSLRYVKLQAQSNIDYARSLEQGILAFSCIWALTFTLIALLGLKGYGDEIWCLVSFFPEDIWSRNYVLIARLLEL